MTYHPTEQERHPHQPRQQQQDHGDKVKQPQEHHDAAGWATKFVQDHGHHSKAFERDRQAAAADMKRLGFGDLTITGAQGHDLVGRRKDGTTEFIGGHHPKGETVSYGKMAGQTQSGHQAELSPDGSGTYQVNGKDKTGHDVAKSVLQDRLKAAGSDRAPTENEIANLGNELGKLNGKHWDKTLREGKNLKVGATVLGDGDPHKTILADGIANHKMEALKHPIDAAKQALGVGGDNAAAPPAVTHAPGLRGGAPVNNEEVERSSTTKNKKGGVEKVEARKGELQDSNLERALGSGGIVSAAVKAAGGWLGHGTPEHTTEKTDAKGLKEGLTYYNGKGADLKISKPDGSTMDLNNVYRTKTTRGQDGNFHINYTSHDGSYSAVYTPDGKTLSLVREGA
jgi:hypothetical protein